MMIFGTMYLFTTLGYASEPWKCGTQQSLGEMKSFSDDVSDPNELGDMIEDIAMFFVTNSNFAEPCKVFDAGITDCEEIVDVHY